MASLFPLYITLGMYSLAASNPILFHGVGNQETTFAGLAGVAVANSMYHFSQFISCYRLDYQLHDITPEEEDEHIPFQPKKNITLDTWSDQECYNKTGFNKCKLVRIYECFGLIALADDGDGLIRIPTGAINRFGMPCCYAFHPEELFLYFMTRMRKGLPHTDMCNLIFGGFSKEMVTCMALDVILPR